MSTDDPYGRAPGSPPPGGPAPGGPAPGSPPPAYPYPGQATPFGPPAPTEPPGKLKTLRVLFLVAGALQAALSLLVLVTVAAGGQEATDEFRRQLGFDVTAGLIYTVFGAYLLHAVLGIVLAARFSGGGNGVRVAAIVWASFLTLFGVMALPLGVLWMALGVTGIVFLSQSASAAWFRRGRQPGAR
ncbi:MULTISPECIES: hypothetical protein [Streptomyces]|uniref:hypothetical protein n=1 Tax=Streptomyces TaxID=1883 RepID=UPI0022498C8F|nr:hypothetical protein [Streptomyces sp. JHD 1]MCX2971500.1 hypothetical protein [Streptomyces sp. JHD 1]